jgi:hypothetical protein
MGKFNRSVGWLVFKQPDDFAQPGGQKSTNRHKLHWGRSCFDTRLAARTVVSLLTVTYKDDFSLFQGDKRRLFRRFTVAIQGSAVCDRLLQGKKDPHSC